jgi:hypothetical protein
MVADGMLTRKRYREVPPRVEYELTERASDLMPILGELARWGYEWAWGVPRAGERVDLGAIFRLAPGLLTEFGDGRGSVELIVEDATDDGPASYVLDTSEDRARIEERHAEEADATVTGTTESWVRAFAPGGDLDGLQISGDRRLASALLDGLAISATRALRAAGSQAA